MKCSLSQPLFSFTMPALLPVLFLLSGCDVPDNNDGILSVTESPGSTAIRRFSSCGELGDIIEPVIYGRPPDPATFQVRDTGNKQGFQCKWRYDRGDDPVPGSTVINKDETTAQTRYITPDLVLQLDSQRRPVTDSRLEQPAYDNVFLTRAEHTTGGDSGTLEFKCYIWQSAEREGEAEVISIVVRFPFPMENRQSIPGDQQVTDMFLDMMTPVR